MTKPQKAVFATEAELCATFIKQIPDGWVAYPETAGFDILLVRVADGAQIGIEAKLVLNAKVLLQAIGFESYYDAGHGPDFRAALVPYGAAGDEMQAIAKRLGITVILMKTKELYLEQRHRFGGTFVDRSVQKFSPELPALDFEHWKTDWVDQMPVRREALPDYVPDVDAGRPSPQTLSQWKIKAIKIAIILERRGFVTIEDFKHIQINRQRWLEMRWVRLTETKGRYELGTRPFDLRAAHPVNYSQIEGDFDMWAPTPPLDQQQEAML